MKTDRELLELAAKAAGLDYRFNDSTSAQPHWVRSLTGYQNWNPLNDDGDALRLAVKLRMTIITLSDSIEVNSYDNRVCGQEMVNDGQDPYAATRRAIVRAAAAIGETE